MKILLSYLLFFSPLALAACRFSHEKIYSLSGPITVAIKELGLLQSPSLKGISLFHPVTPEEYKGKFMPGGVFLSRESTLELKGGLIFFDESRELKKMLNDLDADGREIKTRGLTPIEVTEKVMQELKKVVVDCEKELKAFGLKTQKLAEEVLKRVPNNFSAVFFLGEIRQGRLPEMVMVNDGIVKWLMNEKKLRSYPSELAYVSWSAKIMSALPKDSWQIGLKDPGNVPLKEIKKLKPKKINLVFPGALIPGQSQLETWLFLFNGL